MFLNLKTFLNSFIKKNKEILFVLLWKSLFKKYLKNILKFLNINNLSKVTLILRFYLFFKKNK